MSKYVDINMMSEQQYKEYLKRQHEKVVVNTPTPTSTPVPKMATAPGKTVLPQAEEKVVTTPTPAPEQEAEVVTKTIPNSLLIVSEKAVLSQEGAIPETWQWWDTIESYLPVLKWSAITVVSSATLYALSLAIRGCLYKAPIQPPIVIPANEVGRGFVSAMAGIMNEAQSTGATDAAISQQTALVRTAYQQQLEELGGGAWWQFRGKFPDIVHNVADVMQADRTFIVEHKAAVSGVVALAIAIGVGTYSYFNSEDGDTPLLGLEKGES